MESRGYYFITGLLYPGVLGAYIYVILDKVISKITNNSCDKIFDGCDFLQLIIVVLLFVHYIFDYLYTLCEDENKAYKCKNKRKSWNKLQDYGKWQVLFDICIILSMALAFFILINNELEVCKYIIVLISLVSTKISSLLWEITWKNKKFGHSYAIDVNFIMIAAYVLALTLCFDNLDGLKTILIVPLAIDVILLAKFEYFRDLVKNRK